MRKLSLIIIYLLPGMGVFAHSPNNTGMVTASMNVSVTVVESSHINQAEPLVTTINGEGKTRLKVHGPGNGRISIPSHPQSEMMISVTGNGTLTNDKGATITFIPEINVGRNILEERTLLSDGSMVPVLFTESDNGGYRAIAELQLFGIMDAGDHQTGYFSTVYTVTTEHQ